MRLRGPSYLLGALSQESVETVRDDLGAWDDVTTLMF
jgi:hypothetical protein